MALLVAISYRLPLIIMIRFINTIYGYLLKWEILWLLKVFLEISLTPLFNHEYWYHLNQFTYIPLLAQDQSVKHWQATVDHVIHDMSISTSDMLVCSSMETKILYSNVSK